MSYSREDAEWRRKFVEMLKPLVRERRLEVWSDDRNVVGYEWRPQLAQAIARSRAALLLVSRAFLASDFIMEQELPTLMERGVQLVPVLVRPCLWQAVAALEGLQWAHDPKRDGPLASSADPDGQIVRVCLILRELLMADGSAPGACEPDVLPAHDAARTQPLAAGQRLGQLHNVPPLPGTFVGRAEVAGLRQALLGSGHGTVGLTGKALGLHGQGGIGKTVLAAALACDEVVRRHFPDGVFWVTVGERGDLVAAQLGLLESLGAAHPELRSASQGVALLREVLADRRCLLVVDDVWSIAAAAAFRAAGSHGRLLYTTRDPAVLHGIAADVQQIDVLPPAAARELLRRLTRVEVLPAEADRICAASGSVALALALVGAAIGAGGQSWQQAAEQLDRGGKTFLDHPYADTFKAMQVGIAALDDIDAQAYRTLAVYPEDTMVPLVAVRRLWSYLSGASPEEADARLERLAVGNLLTVQRDCVGFHDLQREFLLLHTRDLSMLHADLLATYRALLPSGSNSWAELPHDEPYIWDHLLYHLRGSGEGAAVRAPVCDLAYIALRCFLSGPYAAESDLRQAAALYPDHTGIGWLQHLLAQSGYLFTQQPTVGDLAATLASRTRDAPSTLNADGLATQFPHHYLAPQWGLSSQAGLIRVLEGYSRWSSGLAFSPDGRQLASASDHDTVRLWDPATGELTAILHGHTDYVMHGLAFSPDGRQLAIASADRTVRLWDLTVGQRTVTLHGHAGVVTGVAFSPDGRQLASASADRTVRLWDPATGEPTATLHGHTDGVTEVAFSPDGRHLASASSMDRTVRLWDPATGELTAMLHRDSSWIRGLAFLPDRRQLASATDHDTVCLWDPDTGELTATLHRRTGWVSELAFSPNGRQFASVGGDGVGGDGMVCLWDLASSQPTSILAHTFGVSEVAFSPDGCQLASASGDGMVCLWDPATGLTDPTLGRRFVVTGVAFSPDGRQLASGSSDDTVRLWDPATGEPTAILQGHTGGVTAVAFSPDGRQLASGSSDCTVRLWDPATGEPTAILQGHTEEVSAVAFSPDGRQLVSGDGGEPGILDHTVRLWDPATGEPIAILEGHIAGVTAVAFSPDGRQLASGDADPDIDDHPVRLWDPATGEPTVTLHGHTDGVTAVAFSPDGRQLASASYDGTVRLWDPATGEPIATLHGHTSWVEGVAFSPDGRQLASAGYDGTVRLWDVRRRAVISQLKVGVPTTALAWGPRGITVAAHEKLLQLAVIDRAINA